MLKPQDRIKSKFKFSKQEKRWFKGASKPYMITNTLSEIGSTRTPGSFKTQGIDRTRFHDDSGTRNIPYTNDEMVLPSDMLMSCFISHQSGIGGQDVETINRSPWY